MITSDPEAEIPIDETFVRRLLDDQFPELSDLSLKFLDSGWDNENYRLGNDYVVRIPRRTVGASLLLNEIKWLPKLQEELPIAIPSPIRIGQPGPNYPWNWSITTWFEGNTANIHSPANDQAEKLAEFLKILHRQDPTGAPENPSRGVLLKERARDVEARMSNLRPRTDLITKEVEDLWHEALLTTYPSESGLIHGDLHPRNIIVEEGQILAVIDWGDITSGDAATDLACLWMLFEDNSTRNKALKHYGASSDLIKRSMGWAIFFGTVLLDTGLNGNEQHKEIGEFTLRNLIRDNRALLSQDQAGA